MAFASPCKGLHSESADHTKSAPDIRETIRAHGQITTSATSNLHFHFSAKRGREPRQPPNVGQSTSALRTKKNKFDQKFRAIPSNSEQFRAIPSIPSNSEQGEISTTQNSKRTELKFPAHDFTEIYSIHLGLHWVNSPNCCPHPEQFRAIPSNLKVGPKSHTTKHNLLMFFVFNQV